MVYSNRFSIAKLAVLVVLFLSSVAVCRPILDFSSIDLDGRDSSAVNALNAIDHGPVYPTTAIAASVVSPYRMEEIRHQGIHSSLSIAQILKTDCENVLEI